MDHCRSFETLDEAMNHCDTLEYCGGVTHSLYGEGQSWHQGTGPFEVRMGPTLKRSNDGDLSWIRIEVLSFSPSLLFPSIRCLPAARVMMGARAVRF